MKIPSVPRLLQISLLLAFIVAVIGPVPFGLDETAPVDRDGAAQMLVALRAALDRRTTPVLPSRLEPLASAHTSLLLTAYVEGTRQKEWQVVDCPLSEGFGHLAEQLKQGLPGLEHPSTRLQLDVVTAEGWVPQDGVLFSLSFVDGHDGVSGYVDGRKVYLPPSELIRASKYGTFKPVPDFDKRFKIGLDAGRVSKTLKHQAKRLSGKESEAMVSNLGRFRALTVVEGADLKPRGLLKGTVDRPALTRERLETAVRAGADYLVNAIEEDGRFHYHYDPVKNRDVKDRYNWPRHAGVSYSLALVGRLLEAPEYVEAAGRALDKFEVKLTDGPDGLACLKAQGKCYLGSSALGLLALSEYKLASGDTRFDQMAKKVAAFLTAMQRDDGFFYHDWYPDHRGIDRELEKLYASQQAVLALAIHARAVGNDGALAGAKRGMDFLAGPFWDHFLGSYFFGQEHWTCLAAEELYLVYPEDAYAELCHGIGVHYDSITHNQGETPLVEDVGGMSVTHMVTPHVGGTATAAEAMVSAVRLGDKSGRSTEKIRAQLADTLGFLHRGQVTAHDTFWIKRPQMALGGVYESQIKTRVRIDTVQHAISAMVRGLDLVPEGTAEQTRQAKLDFTLPN